MQHDIPAYLSVLFIALVVVVLFLIVMQLNTALQKTYQDKHQQKKIFYLSILALSGWLLFIAVLSQINYLNNFSAIPPRLLVVVVPPFIAALILAGSRSLQGLLDHVPLQNLIYLQTFRVAMELILWLLYCHNILPLQMTFEGSNYDILVGLSALFTGYYYVRGVAFFNNKWVLIFWNVAGLVLLANIVTIAVLSAPIPLRYFMNDPANTIVFYFPFVWLPGFVVPVAFIAHLLSLRKLIVNR